MTCQDIAAADFPARYLTGDLSEPEQEAYEGHYFECDACFRELEVLRAARKVLTETPPAQDRIRKPDALPRWLAMAAALLAATTVALWWTGDRETDPEPVVSAPSAAPPAVSPSAPMGARDAELVRMARFDPPRYDPPRLRSAPTADNAAFDRAMADYRRGDFGAAIPRIEEFLRRSPSDLRAMFFLGVALLADGRTEAAIEKLERVRAAGDSPFEEEVLYLLAKAEIRRGDLRAAAAALDRAIALDGTRAAEARALREGLVSFENRP